MTKEQFLEKWEEHRPTVFKWGKRLLKLAGIGFLILVLFVLSVRVGLFGKLPSKKELAGINNYQASEIYSADGVLLGKYFRENRSNVSLEAMSPAVIDALIATEDARFYKHSGVDFWSLFRVFFKTILGGNESSGGGSTISQQLAKNLYPRKNSMPVAKVKEMYTARRLEKVYSKKEILSLYLNTVSFGEEVFGIGVASERYFKTSPDKLKTEEAAVLVGMLKATSYYNPKQYPERAEKRRNTVLAQMLNYDKINQVQYDSLSALPMKVKYNLISTNEGLAPYFREHLRGELKKWIKDKKKPDGTAYNLYTDGLKIRTTIDSKMQTYAEEAVKKHLTDLQKSFNEHWKDGKPWGSDKALNRAMKRTKRYKRLKEAGAGASAIKKSFNTPVKMRLFDWEKGEVEQMATPMDSLKLYYCMLNTGFMAMLPGTGEVKAWVGGSAYKYFKYDHVKSKRQVGSTFKPIVYATALQQGYQPCDYFYNRNTIYSDWDDWEPKNSDGEYGGMLSMEGGLMNSVNTITVDIIMRTGMKDVIALAEKMGIKSEVPEVPSIALGTADISLYEMLQVYGTLANQGIHTKPKYLVLVEDAQGNIIDEFSPKTEEEMLQDTTHVLSSEHAMVMTKILRSVVDTGTARRLRWRYGFNNPIAGKTGTTQSHADGWFIGYTPHIVAGAWVGGEEPNVHFRDISLGQGANMALPIWGEFMQRVYADPQYKKWEQDTFPSMPWELAWSMECPPRINEEDYYMYQNNFAVQDVIISSDSIYVEIDQPTLPTAAEINVKPSREPSAEDLRKREEAKEKARKKREKDAKKKRRKKKRKEFWDKMFNRK